MAENWNWSKLDEIRYRIALWLLERLPFGRLPNWTNNRLARFAWKYAP